MEELKNELLKIRKNIKIIQLDVAKMRNSLKEEHISMEKGCALEGKIKNDRRKLYKLLKEEMRIATKIYRMKNREKMKQYSKNYREANKEKINQQKKEYREANKEKIKQYNKKYREANKEKMLEEMKQKANCEFCNCAITKKHLRRHQRTKKCLKTRQKHTPTTK